MGEGRHEDDGGVGQEGLEDARVPAGDDAKDQSGEEDGGKCCCYHGKFLLRWNEWSSQCKPLPNKRDQASSKDEKEPGSIESSKTKQG